MLTSWSRSGKKLLSAATDNMASIWDIVSAECDKSFRFPSPILKVQFHPRDRYDSFTLVMLLNYWSKYQYCEVFVFVLSKQFLVCPMKHPAVLMNISGEHKIVPLDDDVRF